MGEKDQDKVLEKGNADICLGKLIDHSDLSCIKVRNKMQHKGAHLFIGK